MLVLILVNFRKFDHPWDRPVGESSTQPDRGGENTEDPTEIQQNFLPRSEMPVEGKRSTSRQMIKNKGLTRQRKKSDGNARVANRLKYEKRAKVLKTMQRTFKESKGSGLNDGDTTAKSQGVKRSVNLR